MKSYVIHIQMATNGIVSFSGMSGTSRVSVNMHVRVYSYQVKLESLNVP